MEQKKAPYHPGQAKKTTSYLSKIDSYGRARVSSSPSTVGCRAKRAGGGCHARSRALRSQISACGVYMVPCHPGQAKKTTGYLSKIDNIIRIIPNTRRFRQYYSALPQTTLGVFFVLFLALALYYVLYVIIFVFFIIRYFVLCYPGAYRHRTAPHWCVCRGV